MQNSVSEVPRKDERLTVAFDKETLDRVAEMASQDERPTARQVLLLVRAAIELIDEQGFKLVEGKLRKVLEQSLEEMDY
jgi:hypothetical protein